MYTPGGLVEKTNATAVGDWSISSLAWFTGTADLGEGSKTYVTPADDVIDAMAAANTEISLTATANGQTVILGKNATDSVASPDKTSCSITVKIYAHNAANGALQFKQATDELALNGTNSVASGKFAVRPFDTSTGGDYLPTEFTDYATNTAYSVGDLIKNGDNYYRVTADIEAASNTAIGTVTKTEVTSGVHLNDGITVDKTA